MNKSPYAIEVTGLRKSFGKQVVLDGIDLKVKRGSVMALLGPNGAGKTTTVNILTTLLKANSGTATIEGFDVVKDADEVRSIIGLTGQYAAVDEYLNGRENLRMMGRLYHLSKADAYSRAEELLEQFGLKEAAEKSAKTYSGGMRRRLDLAASLIASPPIIFLDEPTTGLDPRSRIAMWEIIQSLIEGGSTILLTTQYLEEADQLADRIAVIDGGKVIAEGTADQLKEKVGKERIQLEFNTEAELDKALRYITDDSISTDRNAKTLSISNEGGVHTLRVILEKLDHAKIKVESLSLHKPTLDDVFMQLTGHTAVKEESEHSAKKGGKK